MHQLGVEMIPPSPKCAGGASGCSRPQEPLPKELAALAVAGVAAARQWAAVALDLGRVDVAEHQGAGGEMLPGQLLLERHLESQQQSSAP